MRSRAGGSSASVRAATPPRARAKANAPGDSNGVSNAPSEFVTTEAEATAGTATTAAAAIPIANVGHARSDPPRAPITTATPATTPSAITASGNPGTVPTPWLGSSQPAYAARASMAARIQGPTRGSARRSHARAAPVPMSAAMGGESAAV